MDEAKKPRKRASMRQNAAGLTPPDEAFVEALMQSTNVSEAFRQAYPNSRSTGDNVWRQASKKIRRPAIQEAVDKRRQELLQDKKMVTSAVWMELYAIMTSRITELLETTKGRIGPRDFKKLSAADRAALKSVQYQERVDARTGKVVTNWRFEMHDKMGAAMLLSKLSGMQQVEAAGKMPVLLEIAMQLPAGAIPPADMVPPGLQTREGADPAPSNGNGNGKSPGNGNGSGNGHKPTKPAALPPSIDELLREQ